MYETLKFELDGAIGMLTLNVPEKLNAHTKKMRQEMLHFWREQQNNEKECRVVIMTGAGRGFCSGSDIDEMDDEFRPFYKRDIEELYTFQDEIAEVILMMRRAPQPIIAAVRGYAAGGGFSFTMAADIRIADPTAKFVASYINIGLTAGDMGSSFFLPREVNLGFAAEYLLTGEVIDAETAQKNRLCQLPGFTRAIDPQGQGIGQQDDHQIRSGASDDEGGDQPEHRISQPGVGPLSREPQPGPLPGRTPH